MSNATSLFTVGAVAARLGISADRVRQLARAGRLPHALTSTGMRLFSEDDVLRVAEERAATRSSNGTRRDR